MMPSPTVYTLMSYVDFGFNVFPLKPKAKVPAVASWKGLVEKPMTPDSLAQYFDTYTDANVAIITGQASGLLVVDVDGADGKASATKLGLSVDQTRAVKTGKGFHLYFKLVDGVEVRNKVGLMPGIDIRGEGGYITAPPSIHPNGQVYEFINDLPMAEMPESIVRLLMSPDDVCDLDVESSISSEHPYVQKVITTQIEKVLEAKVGERNSALNQASFSLGQWVGAGVLDIDTVKHKLKHVGLAQGLGSKEVNSTVYSGVNAGMRSPVDTSRILTAKTAKTTDSGGTIDVDWSELTPLPSMDSDESLTMDESLLPMGIRAYCVDNAKRLGVSLQSVAIPVVTCLAACIGSSIKIRPQAFGDWEVTPNLWGAIVDRPSSRKSASIKVGTCLLKGVQRELHEDNKELMASAKTRSMALKNKLDKMARTDDPCKRTMTEIQQELDELSMVATKSLSVNDATIERLQQIMSANPKGVLLVRDELAGWLNDMKKSGRESDRQFYLETWNGDGSYSSHRVGRGDTYCENMTLSLLGTTQPHVLNTMFSASLKGEGVGDDGMIQRIQMIVYGGGCSSNAIDCKPDRKAMDQVVSIAERLFDKAYAEKVLKGRKALRFDFGAQIAMSDWLEDWMMYVQCDEVSKNPAFESHLAKYASLVPSLALIFALIDHDESEDFKEVGEPSIELAIQWANYLALHARKLYSVSVDADCEVAKLLLERIQYGDICDGDTIRDIKRSRWKGLTDSKSVMVGLAVLEKNGFIKVVKTGQTRKSLVVYINPKVEEAL